MPRTPLVRPLTIAIAAVLVTGSLAACSGSPAFGGCDPVYPSGDASSAVTASGEVGRTPAVEFPTPLVVPAPQRSVLVAGDGEPIARGSVVSVDYVYFDGATGDAVDEGTALLTAGESHLALGESLICATPGSRLVVAAPASELSLESAGDPDALDPTENLVAVLDLGQVFLGKANGVNQLPLDGMPTVVTAVDGTPGLAIGYATVPDETRVSVIKAGSGATLEEGDTIVFRARSWTWPTAAGSSPSVGTVDSWDRFSAYRLELGADALGDEVLVDALAGEKVGSQILVVLPPDEGAGSATVYVFDLLGLVADE